MSKFFLSSLSILCGLAFAPIAQAQDTEEKTKTVTITKKAFAKGDVIRSSHTFRMEMKMTIVMPPQPNQAPKPPQVMDQKGLGQDDREIEILEVKKGKITKLKVTFQKLVQTMDMGVAAGGSQERPDSLNKRAFTIGKVGSAWTINGEDGPVSEADNRKIKRLTQSLFDDHANGLADAVPAKELKVGQEVKASIDVLKALLDMRSDAFKFSERKLILTGTKKINGKECALFDVKFQAMQDTKTPGGMTMSINGKGKLVIEVATGRQKSLVLTGAPKMDSQPGGPVSMNGDGEIEVKQTLKYKKPEKSEKSDK